MKRFYNIFGVFCIVLGVLCFLDRQLWFGTVFFGILGACCCVMVWLYRQRDEKNLHYAAQIIRIGNVAFALWVCSFVFIEGLVISGAHTDAEALQSDCIFVLGGGIKDDQPRMTLRNRLAVALDLMEQNPNAQVVVCGGQGKDEDYPEAVVMYTWMTEHGGDPTRIAMESKSNDTIENIENGLLICEQNGWETDDLCIVSSNFHLYRVRHLMKRYGLKPCAAGAPASDTPLGLMFGLREYISIVKLAVTGGWQA